MTRPDQTRPDQTATRGPESFERFLEFLKNHDHYDILRKTKRFLVSNFCKPFDPWYHDKIYHNPSPTHESDKIPYIIRRHFDKGGLFSYFVYILGGIAYAEKKGYTPVVDMKHYPNPYLYASEVGHVNSWEYYFTQPDSLTLEEALSCRKYIISRDTQLHIKPSHSASAFYNKDGKLDYWRKLCKKYIHFTQPVLDCVEREAQKFAGKRVLGVSVRGTDYTELRPHGHPVQPTIEQAISKTHEVFGTGSYDAVYLATEDKNIIAAFQTEFGEKLILPEGDIIDFDASAGKWVSECFNDSRDNDKYLRGLEYLVSKLLLTKCNGLITSRSGGVYAMLFSEGFEYLYIFDLGVY